MSGNAVNEIEAADFLGRSVHALRKWRQQGRGPAFVKFRGAARKGRGYAGRVVYLRADLEAYLAEMRVPTFNPTPADFSGVGS